MSILKVIIMKCGICGERKSIFEMKRCKRGFVCQDCLVTMPECIKNSIRYIKPKEIKSLLSLFEKSPKDFVWFKFADIGISDEKLFLGNFGIKYSNIKKAELEFIQREQCENFSKPNSKEEWYVRGDICLVLTIGDYRIRTLVQSARVKLNIFGVYPEFKITRKSQVLLQDEIERVAFLINLAAISLPHDLSDFRIRFFTSQKESGSRKESAYDRNRKNVQDASLLQQALHFYNLAIPFTEEALKKKRKELIIRCHPDQVHRDLTIVPEDVNRYYDILKRYADTKN